MNEGPCSCAMEYFRAIKIMFPVHLLLGWKGCKAIQGNNQHGFCASGEKIHKHKSSLPPEQVYPSSATTQDNCASLGQSHITQLSAAALEPNPTRSEQYPPEELQIAVLRPQCRRRDAAPSLHLPVLHTLLWCIQFPINSESDATYKENQSAEKSLNWLKRQLPSSTCVLHCPAPTMSILSFLCSTEPCLASLFTPVLWFNNPQASQLGTEHHRHHSQRKMRRSSHKLLNLTPWPYLIKLNSTIKEESHKDGKCLLEDLA